VDDRVIKRENADLPLSLNLKGPNEVADQFVRPLRELRVSVIDRCNFRCTYCMPADSLQGKGVFLPLVKLLTDHEMEHLITAFASLGVHKLRITGGEPLVRPGLPALINTMSKVPGIDQIALTTNAVLLPRLAADLKEAGLSRITVSLDTLDQDVLHTMSGGKAKLKEILDGIEAAKDVGFERVKINTVVQRGVNDHTIMDLLDHFRGSGHSVRLIEFMDVGNINHWESSQVVPSASWVERINARWPIRAVENRGASETAMRYEYEDGQGEIGLISSITEPFCGGCTRARITADGILYTCLFANKGNNLMPLIRQSDDQSALERHIRSIWQKRDDRYSEERGRSSRPGVESGDKVEMYRIGG
jgi:cyclic pyranopterin phosphate synthase